MEHQAALLEQQIAESKNWAARLEQGELLKEDYEIRAETLQAFKDAEVLIVKNAENEKKLAKKDAAAHEAKLRQEDLTATSNYMQGALAIMAQGNKNAFRAQKAIAIGKAIMAGFEAAVHSFNWGASWGGPIAGAIMAALSVAATAVYIQNIRKTMQPQAAEGGVFSGPKSGYAATLHGTEAVIPLPNGKSIPVEGTGVGGGGTLNVNIQAVDSQSIVDLMARNPQAIMGPLVEQMQLGNRNLISTIQNTTREE
jgi:hypothetical protein